MATGFLGRVLARYLSKRLHTGELVATARSAALRHAIRPGDVLLVEGNSRFSVAVKYLTQSTWSHAALFVGKDPGVAAQAAKHSNWWRRTSTRACARSR